MATQHAIKIFTETVRDYFSNKGQIEMYESGELTAVELAKMYNEVGYLDGLDSIEQAEEIIDSVAKSIISEK